MNKFVKSTILATLGVVAGAFGHKAAEDNGVKIPMPNMKLPKMPKASKKPEPRAKK